MSDLVLSMPPEGGTRVGAYYRLVLPSGAPPLVRLPADAPWLPADVPADMVEMLQALTLDAAVLLDGLDPEQVGLTLIHPESRTQVPEARGHIVAIVTPLPEMQANTVDCFPEIDVTPRPGHFFAVLLGKGWVLGWHRPQPAVARVLS